MGKKVNDTSLGARLRSKNSRVVALLGGAGALALVLGGVTLATASSASAETVTTIPGNPKCKDLIPGSTEIKFEGKGDNPPAPGSGTEDGVTVTWTQTGDLINFTATGGTVLGAITPLGGLAFLAGWACLVAAGLVLAGAPIRPL